MDELQRQVHMDEIDLQEQVGKGGYGAVYKGTWRGAVVAVKYAICDVEDADKLEQSIREVVLSKKMSHPNVVQTYAWTVLTGQDAAGAVIPPSLSRREDHPLSPPTTNTQERHPPPFVILLVCCCSRRRRATQIWCRCALDGCS